MRDRDGSGLTTVVPTIGRIWQSIVYWCFEQYWSVEETCRIANELGCASVEIVEPKDWPILSKYGLTCALARTHGWDKGMNNPKHWPACLDALRKAIDASADFGCPNVITFTGLREGIPDDVGLENCVQGIKQIIGYAEQKNITICLEILNSRVAETNLGHPGYQGDHTDYCIEIIKRVGSPRLKLLFDIYHVQIMDGDLISRIREHKEYIGHYHTAGNPGRGELGDNQEINYPAVMRAIVESGYIGYVGQELIPRGDPRAGLEEAVRLCNV